MDNAQKAIMIGVGLFITIIIISAVLLIVNLGTGLVDDATAELSTMSSSLQNQILQSYDNKVLSGVQVRSAVQQYLRSTDMVVALLGTVNNNTGIVATVGNTDNVTAVSLENGREFFEVDATLYTTDNNASGCHKTSMTDFNAISNAGAEYIEPSSTYTSYVLRVSGTDTIVGIVFVPSTITPVANQSFAAIAD